MRNSTKHFAWPAQEMNWEQKFNFFFLVNIKTKKEKSKVKEFCFTACCHGYCIIRSIREADRIPFPTFSFSLIFLLLF